MTLYNGIYGNAIRAQPGAARRVPNLSKAEESEGRNYYMYESGRAAALSLISRSFRSFDSWQEISEVGKKWREELRRNKSE